MDFSHQHLSVRNPLKEFSNPYPNPPMKHRTFQRSSFASKTDSVERPRRKYSKCPILPKFKTWKFDEYTFIVISPWTYLNPQYPNSQVRVEGGLNGFDKLVSLVQIILPIGFKS